MTSTETKALRDNMTILETRTFNGENEQGSNKVLTLHRVSETCPLLGTVTELWTRDGNQRYDIYGNIMYVTNMTTGHQQRCLKNF